MPWNSYNIHWRGYFHCSFFHPNCYPTRRTMENGANNCSHGKGNNGDRDIDEDEWSRRLALLVLPSDSSTTIVPSTSTANISWSIGKPSNRLKHTVTNVLSDKEYPFLLSTHCHHDNNNAKCNNGYPNPLSTNCQTDNNNAKCNNGYPTSLSTNWQTDNNNVKINKENLEQSKLNFKRRLDYSRAVKSKKNQPKPLSDVKRSNCHLNLFHDSSLFGNRAHQLDSFTIPSVSNLDSMHPVNNDHCTVLTVDCTKSIVNSPVSEEPLPQRPAKKTPSQYRHDAQTRAVHWSWRRPRAVQRGLWWSA
jgi:hypothetical protein